MKFYYIATKDSYKEIERSSKRLMFYSNLATAKAQFNRHKDWYERAGKPIAIYMIESEPEEIKE